MINRINDVLLAHIRRKSGARMGPVVVDAEGMRLMDGDTPKWSIAWRDVVRITALWNPGFVGETMLRTRAPPACEHGPASVVGGLVMAWQSTGRPSMSPSVGYDLSPGSAFLRVCFAQHLGTDYSDEGYLTPPKMDDADFSVAHAQLSEELDTIKAEIKAELAEQREAMAEYNAKVSAAYAAAIIPLEQGLSALEEAGFGEDVDLRRSLDTLRRAADQHAHEAKRARPVASKSSTSLSICVQELAAELKRREAARDARIAELRAGLQALGVSL